MWCQPPSPRPPLDAGPSGRLAGRAGPRAWGVAWGGGRRRGGGGNGARSVPRRCHRRGGAGARETQYLAVLGAGTDCIFVLYTRTLLFYSSLYYLSISTCLLSILLYLFYSILLYSIAGLGVEGGQRGMGDRDAGVSPPHQSALSGWDTCVIVFFVFSSWQGVLRQEGWQAKAVPGRVLRHRPKLRA